MFKIETYLQDRLELRKRKSMYRTLTTQYQAIDFSSNDYLGFVTDGMLNIDSSTRHLSGAKASRLISGNSTLHEETEQLIAQYHRADAALVFNSGYDANIGLLSCIARGGDTILYDELSHASIHDGIKLSKAKCSTFKHNDLEDLAQQLQTARGNIFIVTEALFSMDGDIPPLREMVALAQSHEAAIIIDEAHSTGVIGEQGRGLVCQLGLEQDIFARIHTFGKAMGCHGAAILGSETLRNYLINYARSFIFTTAIAPHSLLFIQKAYKILAQSDRVTQLHQRIQYFKSQLSETVRSRFLVSESPIQGLIIKGANETRQVATKIQQAGFDVRPIVYPTVPRGQERIRICIHTFNTEEEIRALTELF